MSIEGGTGFIVLWLYSQPAPVCQVLALGWRTKLEFEFSLLIQGVNLYHSKLNENIQQGCLHSSSNLSWGAMHTNHDRGYSVNCKLEDLSPCARSTTLNKSLHL